MKIAVLGCGAIGGLFLGYLADKGYDVVGVVRDYQMQGFREEGVIIEGVREILELKVKVVTRLTEKVDLAIFATKINDLEDIIKNNKEYLADAILVTTQNGIRADYILGSYFDEDKIITSIVMFGGTFYPPNRVIHNFEGDLIMGNIFNKQVADFKKVKSLFDSVFNTVILDNIKGAKYLKVFVNLNNCIPACLDLSIQDTFSDVEISKLAIHLNKEAFSVIGKAAIQLEDLPSFPVNKISGLVGMPIEDAAVIFSKVMTNLSKEPLYGSILQSIRRGKRSEIDYINGEIVKVAHDKGIPAPLNSIIVDLVHQVQDRGEFFTKEELLAQFSDCI